MKVANQTQPNAAMDTIPYFEAGHLARPSLDTSPGNAPVKVIDRALLRIWDYRRLLRSPPIQPFRKVLKPFIRWAFETHLVLAADDEEGKPVDIDVKPTSALAVALGMALGPLVFIMLLPLFLIVVPLLIVIGCLVLAVAAMNGSDNSDDYTWMSWKTA